MNGIFVPVMTASFWASVALVVYAYAGYAVLIWILARNFGRVRQPPDGYVDRESPAVSMILAASNEEVVIRDRLRNALAMDYPGEKLEIIVGSDGSSDRTSECVLEFADQDVHLVDFAHRRGKASVLNDIVTTARGEILLMTDANTVFDRAAARKLTRWFRDPSVGAVVGRLILVDPRTGRNAEALYWKYETFLKRCEGGLGALLGANGAIYAFRKTLYVPTSPGTIVDDFVIPLLATLRTGCSIVYDSEAIAFEETAPDVSAEFRRRVRIAAGGFQSLGVLWKLLDPRRGWIALAFLSHKILRWLCPFFLIVALLCSLLLWDRPFYRAALLFQAGFYLVSLLLAWVPTPHPLLRPLRSGAMESLRALPNARTILMAHNVETLIWERYTRAEVNPLRLWYLRGQSRRFERFERRAFAEAGRLVAVSPDDATLMREKFGVPTGRVDVVPNGIDRAFFQAVRPGPGPGRDPKRILFLGNLEWRANIDAVGLLLDRIFPEVRAVEPSATIDLVGRNPPAKLTRRVGEMPGVCLHASVADVRPFLAAAGVMAVPLRVGGGSRLKILEALAAGLPVVSTRVGAEGLALTPGEHLEVVDQPCDLAPALVATLREPARARAQAERGRSLVLSHYDWDGLADELERTWERSLAT